MSHARILRVLLALLTLAGCSSSDETSQPNAADAAADDASAGDGASPGDAAADDASTDDAASADAVSDAPPGDAGACGKREEPCCDDTECESGLVCTALPGGLHFCLCDTSLCDRFGYVCDGNTQVACGPTAPGSCYVPVATRPCPADAPCDPLTGTCGGCDPSDSCSGKTDGAFLGCMPYTAQWCRKKADGCLETVNESCGIACVVGARQGCCGGEGQMCCNPPSAPCVDGLSCKDDVCAK